MAIWLTILLAILPKLLEWLLNLTSQGKTLTEAQAEKVNHALYLFRQIEPAAVQAGATPGGKAPMVSGHDPDLW